MRDPLLIDRTINKNTFLQENTENVSSNEKFKCLKIIVLSLHQKCHFSIATKLKVKHLGFLVKLAQKHFFIHTSLETA